MDIVKAKELLSALLTALIHSPENFYRKTCMQST